MNYFAALTSKDADSLDEELADAEDRRRQAAGSASANGRRSSGGGGAAGGMKHPLVWIDLEMTGLDVERDSILQVCSQTKQRVLNRPGESLTAPRTRVPFPPAQIAVICTDGELERVVEGPELTIHQPEEVLAGMNGEGGEQLRAARFQPQTSGQEGLRRGRGCTPAPPHRTLQTGAWSSTGRAASRRWCASCSHRGCRQLCLHGRASSMLGDVPPWSVLIVEQPVRPLVAGLP